MKTTAQIVLRVFLFLTLGYCSYQIFVETQQIQKKKEIDAQMNDISHGLLSAEAWLLQLMPALEKKVDGLDLSKITDELLEWVDEIYQESTADARDMNLEKIIGKRNDKALNRIQQALKNSSNFVGVNTLDLFLPGIKMKIKEKILENEDFIKALLLKEAKASLELNVQDIIPQNQLELIQGDPQDWSGNQESRKMHLALWAALCCLYFALLLGMSRGKLQLDRAMILDLLGIALLAIVLGVFCPMIDIDVRLNELRYHFVDETITFDNQSLFYRSKSILQVVGLMIKDNPLVAILIFAFSVLFPLFKLVSSTLLLFLKQVGKHSRFRKIVFNIGKWSMADVFVVAIFLSSLGYQSVFEGQGINTESSQLEVGFYFFLFYCVLSIYSGVLIKRYLKQNEEAIAQ